VKSGDDALGAALVRMDSAIGSEIGWLLLAVVGVAVVGAVLRGRPNWTVIGLFAAAVASLVWSAQSGYAESRYYQPTVALLAVAVPLLLANLPARYRLAPIIVLAVVAVISVPSGHRKVGRWAATERRENSFVRVARQLQETGCPVVVTGIDLERTTALPVLTRLGRRPFAACSEHAAYVAVGTIRENTLLRHACAPGTGRLIGTWRLAVEEVTLTRCAHVTPAVRRAMAGRLPS